jgi:hypothetical protein
MRLGRVNKRISYSHGFAQTKKTSWVVHSWSSFGAQTNMDSQNSPHSNLGEATTFALIVLYVSSHGTSTQMSFLSRNSQVGVPKFPKLGLPQLWGP